MAHGRLLGTIAESGECLIVDPYLRADQLLSLLNSTEANRFLIGPRVAKGEVVAMTTLLSAQGGRRTGAGRAAEGRLHDRYIVGERSLWTLGTSLNAVGRSTSTLLIPVPDAAAANVRLILQELWKESELVAATSVSEGAD